MSLLIFQQLEGYSEISWKLNPLRVRYFKEGFHLGFGKVYQWILNNKGVAITQDGKSKERIHLASPHMSAEGFEQEYIEEAFKTNWIAPLGFNVDKFEEELAQKVGVKYAAALSSGTAAIHLALKAVGVKENDVVFCQSLTFSASANPIKYQGAKPVFIGSDHTWNMCPKALEKALEKYTNDGKKPKLKVASLKQRQIRKHLTNMKSIIKLIHDQTLSFMLKVSRV